MKLLIRDEYYQRIKFEKKSSSYPTDRVIALDSMEVIKKNQVEYSFVRKK